MVRRRLPFLGPVVGVVAAVLMVGAAPAAATFPGQNGRIVFADYMSGQIYAANPDGSALRQLTHTNSKHIADHPSWSPNGARILFSKYRADKDFGENDSRIWIMNADGTNKRRVADDSKGFRDYTPKFTPNAAHIVFTRCKPHDGVCAIWRMRADGTHKLALTRYIEPPKNEAVDFDLSISPNGKRIAYSRFFGGGFQARIFVMHIDGGNRHAVTPPWLEGANPDWAPSGRRIAFENNGTRNGSSLFTIRPNGSDIQRLTANRFPHNDFQPSYSPQGNRIAFMSDRNYPDECCVDLFAIRADGSGEHMIDTGQSNPGLLWPDWGTAPLLP
jgi:Tol biopolymer transport system component